MHAQLPTRERVDLLVQQTFWCNRDTGPNHDAELEAILSHLQLLGGLKSLALQAGTSCGRLRHLKLPTGIKAGIPVPATVVLV